MNNTLKTLWGIFAVSAVAIASYVSNAPALVAIGSLVGIIFVISVAFQNKYANFWGALCGLAFGYFSYTQGLFGNAIIQLGFVVPMSLYGMWLWWKRSESDDGLKRSLSATDKRGIWFLSLTGLVVAMGFSYLSGATMPIMDAITTVLPVVGTFLLVNAYKEQWYIWLTYNSLQIAMWFVLASAASELLALLVMRVVFLVNSVVGFCEWKGK